jgi:hypothetical protein
LTSACKPSDAPLCIALLLGLIRGGFLAFSGFAAHLLAKFEQCIGSRLWDRVL